jgi:hypothetical protein
MRSITRFLLDSLPVTVATAVVLMLAALTALPAAANQEETMLVITVQPTTTQVNTTMTPAVVVDVDNSAGVPVNSFGGPVTLSYVPGSATIQNPPPPTGNTVNAKKGVATFSDVTFSAAGGFELQASAPEVNLTSGPSVQFSIVTQAVQCQPGQACQTETVSDAGTSGFAAAGAGSASDVLTATGGGFPTLSCTSIGGVLTFTVTNRSKTITVMLAKNLTEQGPGPGSSHFNICWGSATPFTTADGGTSAFNMANNEYEGLLPNCPIPVRVPVSSPCIASQNKTMAGMEVTTVPTPPGDGHITY